MDRYFRSTPRGITATDYDEPRVKDDGEADESLRALTSSQRDGAKSVVLELDETDAAEGFELPGAILTGDQLAAHILPARADEFTCMSCFPVRHRSQLAPEKNGSKYCRDCEG